MLLIRALLAVQIIVFAYAAAAHAGVLGSRDDPAAATAETIIAIALAAGLVYGLQQPATARTAALFSQGFALLGTLVGFILVVAVGPTHAFDVTLHGIMLGLLGVGLTITWFAGRAADPRAA